MALPGRQIQRIVKLYATSHAIRRFEDRRNQEYDEEGDPVGLQQALSTILIHHQPIGDGELIKELSEGQRLQDMKKGWTLESVNEKDLINIDGFIFTVNAVREYISVTAGQESHKEVDLLRTGEQDNTWI